MENFAVETSVWAEQALSRRRGDAWAAGFWHLGVGLGLCVAWYVGMTGLYGIPYLLLGFVGVPFPVSPWTFGLLWLLFQFALFPLARRRSRPGFVFLRAEDTGELVVQGPPVLGHYTEGYGQDHDFSFKRGYLGVFLSAQVALDEALREFAEARATRRFDRAGIARLAGVLMATNRKMTLADLAAALPQADLPALLAQAAQLPGFHIHTQEPQGISLTDDGRDGVLVSGVAET